MTSKKIIVLAILVVGFLALSTVSAADNQTGDVVGTDLEIDEVASSVDVKTDDVSGNDDNITDSQDVLAVGEEDVLSASSPAYDKYSVSVCGTYPVGIESDQSDVVVTKAPTHVKSETFQTVIGGKISFYAYVYDESDSNKNIGGTATVKIYGKTYTAKVKDGVAIFKNVKLPLKAKTYKYRIKFSGDKNYKGSSGIYKFKVIKTHMVLLKKNRSIKAGKYIIKLSSKQYKSLIKAFNKGKYKSIKLSTKYKYKFKVPYTKKVKKYKTTKAVKTWYATSYMPMINKMKNAGWKKVSEYTYTKANPLNKQGIGLSAYTYAVCKWVKVSYKTAYKTKYAPVKAKIYTKNTYAVPILEIYSHGKTLKLKGVAVV